MICEAGECEAVNIDGIGIPDLDEFIIISTNWLLTTPAAGDTNNDGVVDDEDLEQLVDYWLVNCNP